MLVDFLNALSAVGYAEPVEFHDERLWFLRGTAPGDELPLDTARLESFIELRDSNDQPDVELFSLRDEVSARRGLWLPAGTDDERELVARLRATSMRARAMRRRLHLLVLCRIATAQEPLRFASRLARAACARLDVLLACPARDIPASAVREAVGWQRARLEDAILAAHAEDVASAHVAIGDSGPEVARRVEERAYDLVVLERGADGSDVRAVLRLSRAPTLIVPPSTSA